MNRVKPMVKYPLSQRPDTKPQEVIVTLKRAAGNNLLGTCDSIIDFFESFSQWVAKNAQVRSIDTAAWHDAFRKVRNAVKESREEVAEERQRIKRLRSMQP